MKNESSDHNHLVLVEGVEPTPMFTEEEYERFRQWWHDNVYPEMLRLEQLHHGLGITRWG